MAFCQVVFCLPGQWFYSSVETIMVFVLQFAVASLSSLAHKDIKDTTAKGVQFSLSEWKLS